MEPERISHYRIERSLGRGGMGAVYEATDLALGRRVALKFMAPELAADSESLQRFEREALAAAALNHPHIATLHAFEREGDRPFIAMELLSGESLRSLLDSGPLEIGEAGGLVRDVADALAYAHRRGVVHRDIKPENLMFDEHRRVKITDFGLARLAHSATVTVEGSMLGTASYMAPECTRGEAGAPADVFALGVVLHELLAGTRPFAGDGPLATMFAIANHEPPALRGLRPEVPEDLEALTLRMLAKAPEQRPSAAEVAAALGGRPAPVSTEAVTVPIERPSPAVPTPASPIARRRALALALGLAGTAVLVVAVLVWAGVRARRASEALGLNNRGVEALGRGDGEQARRLFQRALALDPRLGSARLNLGMVYMSQGRRAPAESMFTATLRRHPRDRDLVAQARYNLGTIDLDTGAYESAVENLGASFAEDSSTARVYNNYGLALVRAGRATDALALLQRGIERFPTAAPLHKNAGLAQMELGRPAEALPYLARALAIDSSLTEASRLREEAERAAAGR